MNVRISRKQPRSSSTRGSVAGPMHHSSRPHSLTVTTRFVTVTGSPRERMGNRRVIISDDPYPMGRLALTQPHHVQQPRRHRRIPPHHPDAGSFNCWSFQKYGWMSRTHSKYDTTAAQIAICRDHENSRLARTVSASGVFGPFAAPQTMDALTASAFLTGDHAVDSCVGDIDNRRSEMLPGSAAKLALRSRR
jgi:hypothetical protein